MDGQSGIIVLFTMETHLFNDLLEIDTRSGCGDKSDYKRFLASVYKLMLAVLICEDVCYI